MSSTTAPSSESSSNSAPATTSSAAAGSMAYTACLTVAEFVDASDLYGEMIARRCREVRLRPDVQSYFATYSDLLYLIVLATPEDPDTVAVVPVLDSIVNSSPRLSMRLMRDEDDLTLLDGLLDSVDLLNELEDLDLPQVFFFDEEWQLADQWGPRPQVTEAYLDSWLERHPEYETLADSVDDADQEAYGTLLEQLTCEMRVWYNSGLGDACADEIRSLLANLQSEDGESNPA